MTAITSEPNARSERKPPGNGRLGNSLTIVLTMFGVALAGTTTFIMNRSGVTPEAVTYVLLADLAFLVILVAMIARKVWRLLSARGERAAGARLHLRLTGIFAIVALAPTVIVAAFATLSVNVGIERMFSTQVGSVVRNSLSTAQAYAEEHRRNIEREVLGMANDMNRAGATGLTELQLVELLHRQQRARRLGEAYLINGAREILHRGEFSYAFTYERPNEDQMTEARLGQVVVVEDQENNELRALVQIGNIFDTYLYVSRPIDGEVLLLLDETQATVAFYNQIEAQRGTLLSAFALVYLGFALLVIATAVWLALWLAERLSRPIGALAFAAERVGDGDLDIRVPEDGSKDEVALLSRIFNRMTAQVKGQRDQLLQANRDSEQRRNFIETVLSGVSAGVIGIDGEGRMEMANDAATAMLGGAITGRDDLPAEIRKVHEAADASALGSAQAQVQLEVGGEKRDFLVRVSARSSSDHSLGYVMTIDDLTALVSAQREAAWGDVARRIAHEIKNPLTPIQLSAERLRRKFAPMVEKDRESFEQYADVIVRQTGDIRRMVDEFSKFARMPKPEKKTEDLSALTRDAVLLQRTAREDIAYELTGADDPLPLECDDGMITQALTNLLKNAAEAIEARIEAGDERPGRIAVSLTRSSRAVSLAIEDNGVGLPAGKRSELTEPYVTTREKGTGLGLAIVKKIAEQHGGSLTLASAEAETSDAPPGARVAMDLPLRKSAGDEPTDDRV